MHCRLNDGAMISTSQYLFLGAVFLLCLVQCCFWQLEDGATVASAVPHAAPRAPAVPQNPAQLYSVHLRAHLRCSASTNAVHLPFLASSYLQRLYLCLPLLAQRRNHEQSERTES